MEPTNENAPVEIPTPTIPEPEPVEEDRFEPEDVDDAAEYDLTLGD